MKPNFIYLLVSLGLLVSCSNSDDGNNAIQTSNYTTALAEHPEANASLGTIAATSNTELTFTISSQNPEGAVQINNLGELTVLDASLFDFELNPQITAQIEIANASTSTTIQATINLTDIDDIAHYLTDSKQAYINANDGQWILVTKNEYNALAQNFINVSRIGTSDEMFDASNAEGAMITYMDDIVGHNFSERNIPDDNYLFAFKYVSGNNSVSGMKIKISNTSADEGYQNLGEELPVHPIKDQYFVFKGAELANGPYMAFYTPSDIGRMISTETGDVALFFSQGDSGGSISDFIAGDHYWLYQGLSTDTKQWN